MNSLHLDLHCRRRTKARHRLGAPPAGYGQVSLIELGYIFLKVLSTFQQEKRWIATFVTRTLMITIADVFLGYLLRGPCSLKFKKLVSAFRFRGKKSGRYQKLRSVALSSSIAHLMYQYAPCRLHICNNRAITALQYTVKSSFLFLPSPCWMAVATHPLSLQTQRRHGLYQYAVSANVVTSNYNLVGQSLFMGTPCLVQRY
jgi:hypothetical protein